MPGDRAQFTRRKSIPQTQLSGYIPSLAAMAVLTSAVPVARVTR